MSLIDLNDNVIKTDTYNTEYTNEVGVPTHEKTTYGNSRVFQLDSENDPELESSSFNLHRMDVIISAIESSLVSTIANFNNYVGSGFVYTMPVLNENDWYEICNNVAVLSFMQGLTIGNFKYYSSYALVSNTKVKDFISRNAIYVQSESGSDEYHNPKCIEFSNQNPSNVIGYANVDYDRKSCQDLGSTTDNMYYYYLQRKQGAYECVVGQNSNLFTSDELIKGGSIEGKGSVNEEVRRAYITALARERGISYKTYGFLNKEVPSDEEEDEDI